MEGCFTLKYGLGSSFYTRSKRYNYLLGFSEDSWWPMPIEAMVEKAMKLIEAGRVERLDEVHYNVVGDHGTYSVAVSRNGRVSCSCPGFQGRGKCSHSTAVVILTQFKRKGGP